MTMLFLIKFHASRFTRDRVRIECGYSGIEWDRVDRPLHR